jgi:CRISPR-associated protein Cas1
MVTILERPVSKVNPPAQNTSPLFSMVPDNLAELQANYGASCSKYEQLAEKKLVKSSTIVVSGCGCSLRVKNDALVIFPGKTHAEQVQKIRILHRAVHGTRHIVLIADRGGVVSLEAIKWASDQDIATTVLDGHGNIVQSLSTCHADAKLRRSQYGAGDNGKAGKVSCDLVMRKVKAQLETLKKHPELPGQAEAMDILEQAVKWFDLPELPPRFYDVNWLRTFEGRCADAYFRAWQGVPVKWDKQAQKAIPPHWQVVTQRSFPLSHNHGAWKAVNPAQAILNYAYAILESQVRQALNSVGFDVSAGFLHSDELGRDSLVFDLMEIHRPAVDHKVLSLLATTTLAKGDIMSSPTGEVRFNPQLARYIAASCRLTQGEIDESAKWLKTRLLAA